MRLAAMTLVGRYVAGVALRAFILAAAALTGLLSLLEFVEQLASVGQGHYRVVDAFIHVLLTAPARLLQVMPLATLLGSLLALGPLAGRSELTAMLSLGIPERRIVGTIAVLTLPIAVVLFLLAQFVIPPAQQLAQSRRAAALSSSASLHEDDSVWAQDDRQYLNVQRFARADVPTGIDIYSFAPDGSLDTMIHADHAVIRPDGTWLLADVTRRRGGALRLAADHLAMLPWHSFLPPWQARFLVLPVRAIPPVALVRTICDLRHRHQKTTRYAQELWAKASIPLSMVAMVMVAAPLAFGRPRARNAGRDLARGLAVGIVFSLAQQIVARLGLLLEVAPSVTALAPPLMLMVLAFSFSGAGGRSRPPMPQAPQSPSP